MWDKGHANGLQTLATPTNPLDVFGISQCKPRRPLFKATVPALTCCRDMDMAKGLIVLGRSRFLGQATVWMCPCLWKLHRENHKLPSKPSHRAAQKRSHKRRAFRLARRTRTNWGPCSMAIRPQTLQPQLAGTRARGLEEGATKPVAPRHRLTASHECDHLPSPPHPTH